MSQDARDDLKEILNQREYQIYYEDSRGFLQLLIDRIQEWIAEQLLKLFPAITPSSGVSGFVFIILILITVGILIFILFKLIERSTRKRSLHDKPLQHENELKWTVEQHLDEAKKQEEIGDYSIATRHMFLALLLYFHGINWLEARIWKTNLEYYEELKEVNLESASFFYEFVLLFDEITYGDRQVKEEEYKQCKDEALIWLEKRKGEMDRG
ncbi:DUF4129 domain-containing protein [Evansella tamaricis]|uniref:DUF4129 domain-containing protein n=1 Tax=Evansella tamaricis TaxID=2069301 RepID=A0ABS6JA65_9BACI|nr:DUF4129 domain-containing protein [Evansella tamaricis]MBU9710500.1 DUF4129 domain-containing protein [Evansella tamaricis]